MNEKILGWLLSGSLGSAMTFAYNYWENKKKSHFSNVTNQRIKWADEIRMNIAEFIAGIQIYLMLVGEEKKNKELELILKMEIIELLLNPLMDDFDENYITEMRNLFRNTTNLNLN